MFLHTGLAYHHIDMQEEAIRSFEKIDALEEIAETTPLTFLEEAPIPAEWVGRRDALMEQIRKKL